MTDCTGQPLDYDDLDPGIRETVRLLRKHGFDTTDSGDGVTKLADGEPGCATDFPHVIIQCDPRDMVATADRLHEVLTGLGIPVTAAVPDGEAIDIQASYDPSNGIAIVALSGLDDARLAGVA